MLAAIVISLAHADKRELSSADFVTIEEKHQDNRHWQRLSRVEGFVPHEIVLATKHNNLDKLEEMLMAVSTPGNERFGKHLTPDEVEQKFTETRATSKRLLAWVKTAIPGHEVVRLSPRGEYIRLKARVDVLESALSTEFYYWEAPSGKVSVRAYEHVKLPSNIAGLVHTIFRTVDFPPTLKPTPKATKKEAGRALSEATNLISPSVLNSFYNIGSNIGSASATQAVFETSGQTYSPSDLAAFQSHFSLPSEKIFTDVGGHASDATCSSDANDCAEANLDVQYMMAVSQTAPTTFYYEANEEDPFVAFVEAIAAESTPSLVNSISYGSVESAISKSTMDSFNTEAMKLGTIGASVFVSSGDDGVANYEVTSTSQCAYNPSYPATSPYVTAVGATYSASWTTPGEGEVVCQSNDPVGATITSGGGFSAIFDAPSYQTSAISAYFSNVGTQPKSGYASGGRGYPDLALSGYGYEVVIGDDLYTLCGTSCSAPSVAGMVSLINSVRLAAGASSVGFLNPSIYASGASSAFNDITSGENQCTADNAVCCSEGFYAAAGWDPTTGFGSVDYAKLKTLLTSDLSVESAAPAPPEPASPAASSTSTTQGASPPPPLPVTTQTIYVSVTPWFSTLQILLAFITGAFACKVFGYVGERRSHGIALISPLAGSVDESKQYAPYSGP